MAYEKIQRNIYYEPGDPPKTAKHDSQDHYDDFEEFHLPLERLHNSNLHDWGIARGLEVRGTIGEQKITVCPGVANDSNGQLISLSTEGGAVTKDNLKEELPLKLPEYREVLVPVDLSTENYAEKTVYVTISFFEELKSDSGVVGKKVQKPLVQLQPVNEYDGKSIVLAIAVIDKTGNLAELKARDGDLPNCRRLIGESVEELRIQRSGNVEGTVQDIVTGKIGPGDGSGLKITVPDAKDNVLFAKEDGGDFQNLGINANVGIGTANPSARLEVNGDIKANANLIVNGDVKIRAKSIKLGLEKYGGGQLILKNNFNDNSIYLEAFSSSGKGSASELVLSGENNRNVPVLRLNAENTFINGNVGIGTADPKDTLDVYGQIRLFGQNAFQGSDSFLRINPDNNFPSGTHFAYRASFYRGITTGDWCDVEPGKGNLLVQGNVGIGTADPKDTLDVYGQIRLFGQNAFQGSDPFLRINPDNNFPSGTHFAYRANFYRGITTGEWWNVEPGIGNLLVDGNVGIGTADPKGPLDVYGQIRLFGQNAFQGSDGYLRINQDNNFSNGTHFAYRASFYRGITTGDWCDVEPGKGNLLVQGNVGIGTINPSEKLEVAGNIKIIGQKGDDLSKPVSDGLIYLQCSIIAGDQNDTKNKALTFVTQMQDQQCLSRSIYVGEDWVLKANAKHSLINHPLCPNTHHLVHSTLEGPEIAVYYRGESQLSNGEATISLPDYFEALTRTENRTALLTPKLEDDMEVSMLAASEVKGGKFTVKMIDHKNPEQKFYWEVKAVRKDVRKLKVKTEKKF